MEENHQDENRSRVETAGRTAAARPLDIVLVEDDDIWAEVVRLFLDQPDFTAYDLRRVSTLEELQNLRGLEAVDVILSDLSLPDAFGIEIVERERQFAPNVPIVVLTGSAGGDLLKQVLLAGAQECLIKGHFDPADLHRSIRRASVRD